MTYYNLKTVNASVPVRQYLNDAGVRVRGHRCVAAWRGGEHLSVAIYDANGENHVFDNVTAERLSVIDLCMRIEGRTLVEAKVALAERYGIRAEDGSAAYVPRPITPPCWTVVAWLVTHATDADAMRSAQGRTTEEERRLAVRIVMMLAAGVTLGEAITRLASERRSA